MRGDLPTVFAAVYLLAMVSASARAAVSGYVGSEVCAGCHKAIAQTQAQTNMRRTWQGVGTPQLPVHYSETHAEGPAPAIDYKVQRVNGKIEYQVQMPGQAAVAFPVEAVIGGKRHGVTFLYRVPALEGTALPRVPLVEGRYIHSVLENGLALELGFPEDKPTSYETGFGRILTPTLEKRCFSCHVEPRTWGTRVESGVGCENCHGPGQKHLAAVRAHSKDLAILNPDKLPVAERFQPCTQCHAGSGFTEDPLGGNLLISDQVTGLKNSECWRQSGGEITCTNCHNPHQDATRAVLVARGEKTCLGCHSAGVAKHAGLCPVNRTGGCVGCHMPNSIHGAFHLADHWIRVHPEQKTEVPVSRDPAWRTTLTPRHMYLREIVLDDASKAAAYRQQLQMGGSFFEIAWAHSLDRTTKINGGYMGDLEADKLDPAWSGAVLKLQPGEISEVVPANGKYLILQRMPRNFREEADSNVNDAIKLRKEGKQQESVAELTAALKIYPYFLRALTYLGINYAQTGKPEVGARILGVATHLYPRDQGAHFNLGVAYGAMGKDEEIAEYQRTLEIDPDYVPAYLNWGGALFTKGKYDEAIALYRRGIAINPLSALLHYSLSVALDRVDRKQEAQAEMVLAGKIDGQYRQ